MTSNIADQDELANISRPIHLKVTIFGISAWATGFWAGDYKRVGHLGFGIYVIGPKFQLFSAIANYLRVWGPTITGFLSGSFTPRIGCKQS